MGAQVRLKKITTTILLSATALTGSVFAQTTTTEPESLLNFNVGFVSDYRYRGISQTARKPALQGGIDYTDKSGFYVGNWNSNIEWIKDAADTTIGQSSRGPIEMDFYAGYKNAFNELIGYDAGVLQYYYPTSNLGGVTNKPQTGTVRGNYSNAMTTELYGAVNIGAFAIKLSDSVTNLFGYVGTKNSMYVDLSYSFDFGEGLTSIVHYGNQSMKASNASVVTSGVTDYSDYSMSLNKDFDGLVVSATMIANDWSRRGSAHINDTLPGSGATNIGASTVVLGVKKNF